MSCLFRSGVPLLLLFSALLAVASSFSGVPTTQLVEPGSAAAATYRGRRAVNDTDNSCLYIATLKASMASGTVGLKGSVVAYNQSGVAVATFASMPLAVAVDPGSNSLFVSTPVNIQQYDIEANLASGQQSCPCSFSTLSLGESVIQTMAVDQVGERLYFAIESTLCYRLISGSEIACRSYNTSGTTFNQIYIPPRSERMYITTNELAEVYVISLAIAYYLDLVAVWSPVNNSDSAFNGITIGPSGNLYMLLPMQIGQPCAAVEVDISSGSMVSCFSPPVEKRSLFETIYGLIYNNSTQLFYTFISVANSNATHVNTTTGYDIQMFDLVPSNTSGQLTNSMIDYLVTGIVSPADGTLGPCPHPASPSPSPVHKASSSAVDTVAIAVPVVLGSVLLLLLAAIVIAGACFLVGKRRRKYFDSGDGGGGDPDDPEAGAQEMSNIKFTFREIDGKDLRLGKLLGEGAFGKVYKGEYRGAVVAVKMFEALRLDQADEKVLAELRMEAQMMERLSNHPNIVKFVGAITKGDEAANFALVTEFCPRGSLYDLLVKNKKKLPLITLVRMARDAASGIFHLHKEHIVHRDIAARNILVGQNYEVYVSDFGLARVQEADGQVATTKQNFGPLAWMAPEALKSREYSEHTDSFSFGVLLWEMMTRKRPWAGVEPVQIITSVTSNTRLRIPKDCDPIFAQLMKMCWRQNPSQRPSFEKIADVLSTYYKKLHKLHDISADAYELSDQESQEESEDEMALEGLSYKEWQLKRIKDEVKSFMKQLITERNDDFALVAKANSAAFVELKEAFDGAGSEDSDDSDETYDDNDEDDDHSHDDKRKDYLENEILFAESGEAGQPDRASGDSVARATQLPVSHYVQVAPKPQPIARLPTITYAEVGRSASSGDDVIAPPARSTSPSDGAAIASPSTRKKTKTKARESTKGREEDAPLPMLDSEYVDLGRKTPGPPHQESQVFEQAYVTLESRGGAEPTIMMAKEWKDRGRAQPESRANGYEEITAATAAAEPAPVDRPQDSGYYVL